MKNSLWSVSFSSGPNMFGSGVAVMLDGRFYGGDASYYYKGNFSIDGSTIKADVLVKHHTGPPNSIFGPLLSFNLSLNGQYNDTKFLLTGTMKEVPNVGIQVTLKKLEDIS
ncbi:MAG: hypothetical protein HQK55_09575 [Deltaproteobacteria bacterium]|nr:hypothetical protein [Deltaproteobacteria bacterium]